MPNDPLAGRGLRAPERSRMLVATEDGIFLRPGAALAERRGNGFVAAEPREINSRIGALFGPGAIYLPVASAVEIACVHLRAGNRDAAQRALDRLALPPVSPNGARLLRAIAKRQGLATPVFAETTKQAGTIWTEDDVESFAALDDRLASRTRVLEKIFNPGLGWDPAKHPRWPEGQSDGGEFRPADGSGSGSSIRPAAAILPQPLLGKPPKIPKRTPPSEIAKNNLRKELARWLANAALLLLDPPAAAVISALHAAVEGTAWAAHYVKAYLDPPKTLAELQAAVQNPRAGYEIHHIVEQTPARIADFSESQIEDPSNLALVPSLKHWELTGWFMRRNKDYGNVSPRSYLVGRDWETRTRIGLDGLRAVGVLKK